jgi:hypothetical protein
MKFNTFYGDLLNEDLSDFKGYNTKAALEKEKNLKGVSHYSAIDDLDLNTLNRNKTIKEYGYGPLNPNNTKSSENFWKDKANMWETTVEMAKSSRCKNCSMFNQTKEILDKIAESIGPKGKEIVKNSNLGYCELFWFKCAGDRTCDAWIVGGPLK